jgi:hypothetical protein
LYESDLQVNGAKTGPDNNNRIISRANKGKTLLQAPSRDAKPGLYSQHRGTFNEGHIEAAIFMA